MKQRINTETLTRINKPHSKHDGFPVKWKHDTEPPTLPAGEAYAEIIPRPTEEPAEGKMWQEVITATEITWEQVDIPPVVPQYGAVRKYTFFKRLKALGKWNLFKIEIKKTADVEDLYDNAHELDINDPDVIALAPAIKAAINVSDAQYQELFRIN